MVVGKSIKGLSSGICGPTYILLDAIRYAGGNEPQRYHPTLEVDTFFRDQFDAIVAGGLEIC